MENEKEKHREETIIIRITASPCSGKDGGPPSGGLKTMSTNLSTSVVHIDVIELPWFLVCWASSFFMDTLCKLSMCSSPLTRSKRIAIYIKF